MQYAPDMEMLYIAKYNYISITITEQRAQGKNIFILGCYLMYARTRDLQSLIRRLFLQYGDIFVLSLFSQKIVFLKDTRVRRCYLALGLAFF
jgi:hypothetical protein